MKITLHFGYKVISQNSISNNRLKLAIIKQISKAHPEVQFLYLKIIYIIHILSSKNNWTYSKKYKIIRLIIMKMKMKTIGRIYTTT